MKVIVLLLVLALLRCESSVVDLTSVLNPNNEDSYGQENFLDDSVVGSHSQDNHDKIYQSFKVSDFLDVFDRYIEIAVVFISEEDDQSKEKSDIIFNELKTWKLKHTESLLAKVIVHNMRDIPANIRPESLPNFIYFVEERRLMYHGNLEPQNIRRWLSHVSLKEVETINDQKAFEDFIAVAESPKLIAFYTSQMTEELKLLQKLVKMGVFLEMYVYEVGACFDNCSISFHNYAFSRPSLVIIRNTVDHPQVAELTKGLTSDEDILQFCAKEAVPTVIPLTKDVARFLFKGFAPLHAILLLDPKSNNQKVLENFGKSAIHNRYEEDYSQRILHSIYYVDEGLKEINETFNLREVTKLPQLFAVNVSEVEELKYKFNQKEELNLDNIKKFLQDFKQEKLKRYLQSEPEPSINETKFIEKLVGNNFMSKSNDSLWNYVILFCQNIEFQPCIYAYKILEETVKKLHKQDLISTGSYNCQKHKIKFGYINTDQNEFDIDIPHDLPVLGLFPAKEGKDWAKLPSPNTIHKVVDWLKENFKDLDLKVDKQEEHRFEEEKLLTIEKEKYERQDMLDEMARKLKEEERFKSDINDRKNQNEKINIDL